MPKKNESNSQKKHPIVLRAMQGIALLLIVLDITSLVGIFFIFFPVFREAQEVVAQWSGVTFFGIPWNIFALILVLFSMVGSVLMFRLSRSALIIFGLNLLLRLLTVYTSQTFTITPEFMLRTGAFLLILKYRKLLK